MKASYLSVLFADPTFTEAFHDLTSYRGEFRVDGKGLYFYTQSRERLAISYETPVHEVALALKAHIQDHELSRPLLLEALFIDSEEGYWYRQAMCGGTMQIWLEEAPGLWCVGGDFSTKPCPLQGKGTLEEMITLALAYADKVKKEYLYGPNEIAKIIARSLELNEGEFPKQATQVFGCWIDQAFWDGAFKEVGDLLDAIDTDVYLACTLTGVLMFTYAGKEEIGDARLRFKERAAQSLADKHQWDEERVDRAMQRLA